MTNKQEKITKTIEINRYSLKLWLDRDMPYDEPAYDFTEICDFNLIAIGHKGDYCMKSIEKISKAPREMREDGIEFESASATLELDVIEIVILEDVLDVDIDQLEYDFHNLEDLEKIEKIAEYKKILQDNEELYHAYPVSKYEHGNVRYYIGSPTCRFDSGTVGYLIFKGNQKNREKLSENLDSHFDYITDVINGNVYGYTFEDQKTNEINSCGGFVGDLYLLKKEMKIYIHSINHNMFDSLWDDALENVRY